MPKPNLLAEFIGTAFLLIAIVGSGIMAEAVSGGSVGLALFPHAVAVGAVLFGLITLFGPVSGAHFNPAVTMVFLLRGDIPASQAARYVATQIIAAIVGVMIVHLIYEQPLLQIATKARTGHGQWISEALATFGLLMIILGGLRTRPQAIPAMVGAYVTAAMFFASSTGMANPAVSIARSLTDTFTGIQPAHVPGFVIGQIVGALLAWKIAPLVWRGEDVRGS